MHTILTVKKKKFIPFNSLSEAERITQKSYKECETTVGLGFALMQANSAMKASMLKEKRDTLFFSTTEYYLEIIEENGFERCFKLDFAGENKESESFFVYWHNDGILLAFDTHNEKYINSAKCYYNWKQTKEAPHRVTSSTSPIRPIDENEKHWPIAGNHDAREALITHMDDLREYGHFINPWLKKPFLWLLHYMDTKDEDYDAINSERIAMLPKHVQNAIKGSDKDE